MRILLLALVLLTPATLAGPGPAYVDTDRMGAGTGTLATYKDYGFWVNGAGRIDAVLAWPASAGSLQLSIQGPIRAACGLTDVTCLVDVPYCRFEYAGGLLDGNPLHLSKDVPATGYYIVRVGSHVNLPTTYTLSIQVEGASAGGVQKSASDSVNGEFAVLARVCPHVPL